MFQVRNIKLESFLDDATSSTDSQRLPNRCDQCNRKCIKCDRNQPVCSQCERSKLTCTFLRKIKNKNNLHFLDKNITCFKANPKSSDAKLESENSDSKPKIKTPVTGAKCLNRSLVYSRKGKGFYINLNNSCGLSYDFFTAFPMTNGSLCNLMTLLQCPSKDKFFCFSDSSILVNFVKKFVRHMANSSSITTKKNVTNLDYSIKKVLNLKAIQSYFENAGLFGAVCTPITFNRIPRSTLFINVILLSGLLRLPSDQYNSVYLKYIENEVRHQTKDILRLPASLDTIQSFILIISNLMIFPWARKLWSGMLKHCVRLSQLLGLHAIASHLSPIYQLERRLTYNTLMYLETYSSLIALPTLFIPVQFSVKFSMLKLLQHFSQDKLLKSCPYSQFFLTCLVIFNNYLGDYNILIFKAASLKWQFSFSSKSMPILEKELFNLLQKIDLDTAITLNILTKLCPPTNQPKISQLIKDFINVVLLLKHYLRFIGYTLGLYRLTDQTRVEVCREYIESAIIEGHQVLIHGTQINRIQLSSTFIAKVTQSLIFILRHKQYIQYPTIEIRCFDTIAWFRNLLQDPLNSFFSSTNLCLIDVIANTQLPTS